MTETLKKAEELYKENRIKEALAITKDLADNKNKKGIELHIKILMKSKQHNEALKYADLLHDIDKHLGLVTKAQIFTKLVKPKEAKQSAKSAYELKKDAKSIYTLGTAEMVNKNYIGASLCAKELLELNQRESTAKGYFLLGLVSMFQRDFQKAKDNLLKAKKDDLHLPVDNVLRALKISKNAWFFGLLGAVLVVLIAYLPIYIATLLLFLSLFLAIYLVTSFLRLGMNKSVILTLVALILTSFLKSADVSP